MISVQGMPDNAAGTAFDAVRDPVRPPGALVPNNDTFRNRIVDAVFIEQWRAAVKAGDASAQWARFVDDLHGTVFRGARKQQVLDALAASVDLLPVDCQVDAIARLLEGGVEGEAAVREFVDVRVLGPLPRSGLCRLYELFRKHDIDV
ncbi:hypothetical protein [Pandoraea pulmonicola]|uniref:Uncharacterized protein n=2 Tax=Pandoraea pulmonicola TaxID=93221 RepID=A0AAJ4ZAT6_PANPU|nr:hypothetical protein [Pandoraea pulmonicola]SUA89984.1 Uncharacterised protein [Pandoraea pulmonicola]